MYQRCSGMRNTDRETPEGSLRPADNSLFNRHLTPAIPTLRFLFYSFTSYHNFPAFQALYKRICHFRTSQHLLFFLALFAVLPKRTIHLDIVAFQGNRLSVAGQETMAALAHAADCARFLVKNRVFQRHGGCRCIPSSEPAPAPSRQTAPCSYNRSEPTAPGL